MKATIFEKKMIQLLYDTEDGAVLIIASGYEHFYNIVEEDASGPGATIDTLHVSGLLQEYPDVTLEMLEQIR